MPETYKVQIEIALSGDATSYPAGWLEGAIQHIFETYNDRGDLVAVRYKFDGMDRFLEIGVGS